MTPQEFRAIRKRLGLSTWEMARMLGLGKPLTDDPEEARRRRKNAMGTIRHIEQEKRSDNAREPSETLARLMQAYADGYRPRDWPTGRVLDVEPHQDAGN